MNAFRQTRRRTRRELQAKTCAAIDPVKSSDNNNYYVEAVELSAMGNDFLLTDSEDSGDEGHDDSNTDDAKSVDNSLFQHIQAQKAVLGSRKVIQIVFALIIFN